MMTAGGFGAGAHDEFRRIRISTSLPSLRQQFSPPPAKRRGGVGGGGWRGINRGRVPADRPPTPDPSPPRALRVEGGELTEHDFAISPHVPREFCFEHPALQSEGAGNAGRPMRPITACAMMVVERTRVGQVTPEITQHSPRNGFNGFLRALPGDRAFLPPSSVDLSSTNLTPASGRQDHATSPSASGVPVLQHPPRPSHPAPR
jgi:hypothetical protein